MKAEQVLISTIKDVKELNKIMRNQIKHYGPFILNFEFGDDKHE